MIPIVVAATMKHHENPCEVKEMKKILLKDDILVIDGKEFSYDQLTRYLTERIIFKKQIETVKSIAQGGASE